MAAANANGDISNPGTNVANYNRGADWNGLDGNLTTVGSAGPLSQTFYGTWDQAGNVFEWSEAAHPSQFPNLEGSGFERGPDDITSFRRSGGTVDSENYIIGFRVAAVPEPSTLALAMLGALSLLIVAYCKP